MLTEEDYRKKAANEKRYFDKLQNFSALPEIVHWWASLYLAPRMETIFGISGGNKFYLNKLINASAQKPFVRVVSLGSGDGEVEISLARDLLRLNVTNVSITGLEISEDLVAKANRLAGNSGVGGIVNFIVADLNKSFGSSSCDFIIANQVLHHLMNLEAVFDGCVEALSEDGILMTRDMIGRNGHQAWPEAREVVDEIWDSMPDRYKYDRRKNVHCDHFPNTDFSTSGFEGIRSQDVLPLINERFSHSAFYAFGGIVERFINRSFGPNYSSNNEEDTEFVKRLQAVNDNLLDSGKITPTQICAYFTKKSVAGLHWLNRTPELCVRHVSAPAKLA